MKSTHKRVWAVALTAIVVQAPDEVRSIEYGAKVQRAVQCRLWRLPFVPLDVLEQNFQQGIGVKSGDLAIYQGGCNREPVRATCDAGERSQ